MNETINWHEVDKIYQYKKLVYIEQVQSSLKEILNYFVNYTKETVEHFILGIIFYTLTCILLYYAIIKWKWIGSKRNEKNFGRTLFVIAHPDDECMFFGPTILNLTRNLKEKVFLLCLSIGNADGLGKQRKQELYNSCKILGIDSSCITIYNHSSLPDSMETKWPIEIVSKLILNHIEQFSINTVVTFDKNGISQHLNHCSIYYAIAYLILEKKIPKDCTIYVLETINLLRKYWLLLDIPITLILSRTRYLLSFDDRSIIHNAMKEHKTQMVWFRRLYMPFSRYMLMNSLQEMKLSDIELDLQIDD